MYMSKMLSLHRKSTLALRQRKAHLLRALTLPPHLLHASLIERFLKCGKANCACHADGPKHGPFWYLNRCFGAGQFQSRLLKSKDQIAQARAGLAAYAQVQQALDELSQINYELLQRNEPLNGSNA
jgi:hypothetical protein